MKPYRGPRRRYRKQRPVTPFGRLVFVLGFIYLAASLYSTFVVHPRQEAEALEKAVALQRKMEATIVAKELRCNMGGMPADEVTCYAPIESIAELREMIKNNGLTSSDGGVSYGAERDGMHYSLELGVGWSVDELLLPHIVEQDGVLIDYNAMPQEPGGIKMEMTMMVTAELE